MSCSISHLPAQLLYLGWTLPSGFQNAPISPIKIHFDITSPSNSPLPLPHCLFPSFSLPFTLKVVQGYAYAQFSFIL